jgi:perosamine synthetase
MPCGDGGMITLNDEKLYNKLKEMTWFGVSSTFSRVAKEDTVTGKPGYTWDYEVDKIGYKCYMLDLQAAICLEQMKKLPEILKWRRHVQSRYNNELTNIIEKPPHSETVQYYCAKVPAEHRGNLIDYLASKNIHTSVHFKPLHKYEIIKKHMTHPDKDFPVAVSSLATLEKVEDTPNQVISFNLLYNFSSFKVIIPPSPQGIVFTA